MTEFPQMTPLTITPNLEAAPWLEMNAEQLELNPGGETAKLERIGILPNATAKGLSAVEVLIRLPDGRHVIAETTLRLFLTAANAIAASPIAELERDR